MSILSQIGNSVQRIPITVHAGLMLMIVLPIVLFSWQRGSSENHVEVIPVKGRIAVGEQDSERVLLVLHPRGHSLPTGYAATAVSDPSGNFRFRLSETNAGVPPGEYALTATWNLVEPDGSRGANLLPSQYSDPDATPLHVDVQGAEVEIPLIVIANR